MWLWIATDDFPYHQSWGGACLLWTTALWKMTLTRSMPHVDITHIQTEPTLITEDNRVPFHSPVNSFRLGGVGVLVLVWPETHLILVVLQANGSQWPLLTQQVQYLPGFLPWILFGQPLPFIKCVIHNMCLYYAAIQNLIYGHGNVPLTVALRHIAIFFWQCILIYLICVCASQKRRNKLYVLFDSLHYTRNLLNLLEFLAEAFRCHVHHFQSSC